MKLLSLLLLVSFAASAEDKKPTGRPPMGGAAMKQVICLAVEEARGKTGQDLANEIEHKAAELARSNYALAGLLPGEPPIACFRSLADPSKLPMGAR
jgi:hypothetical protein